MSVVQTFYLPIFLLSAAIRWSWRETALTAAAVLLLFAAAGTAAILLGTTEFDLVRLMMRSAYLVVLSLLFVWFGVNEQPVHEADNPLWRALESENEVRVRVMRRGGMQGRLTAETVNAFRLSGTASGATGQLLLAAPWVAPVDQQCKVGFTESPVSPCEIFSPPITSG